MEMLEELGVGPIVHVPQVYGAEAPSEPLVAAFGVERQIDPEEWMPCEVFF